MLERAYEFLKKYGWPHFFVPLFALVMIDYIYILFHFVQVALCAYIIFQSIGLVLGMAIGMLTKINDAKAGMWADVLNYRIAALVPTIGWGAKLFDWLLTENK